MLDDGSKQNLLNNLSLDIERCVKCELSCSRTFAVPGSGAPSSTLMFVGEAPGHNEDISGEHFLGSAGKLLTSLLNEIQMSRESVYITNIVKCRPPNNRDPHPNEITLCEPYLDAQISIVDPVLILPLGRFAMNYFIPGESITRISGTVQKIQGRYVYPLLHPAAALRRTEYKQRLRNDFLNIPSAVDRISLLSKGMDFGSFDQMRLT